MSEEPGGAEDPGRHEPSDSGEEARGRLAETLAARRQKLERVRGRGGEPFALGFEPDASLDEIRQKHQALGAGEETMDAYRVAGRIMLLRRQGKLSFITLRDGTGDLQLFLTPQDLGDGYTVIDDLDLGDIVGAHGRVMTTKRGELSLRVDRLELLT